MKFLSNKEWQGFKVLQEKQDVFDLEKKNFEILMEKKEIQITNKNDALIHKEKMMQESFDLKEKQVTAAYEDKLSKEMDKLRVAHQKELNDVRTELNEKNQKSLEKMLKENYDKLSSSMTKLHEEGNATTKHMSEMTKEVIRASGLAKSGHHHKETLRIENVNANE